MKITPAVQRKSWKNMCSFTAVQYRKLRLVLFKFCKESGLFLCRIDNKFITHNDFTDLFY